MVLKLFNLILNGVLFVVFGSYLWYIFFFFFFKQKTAYEMRISDWSSDVCSSDLFDVRIVFAVYVIRLCAVGIERIADAKLEAGEVGGLVHDHVVDRKSVV